MHDEFDSLPDRTTATRTNAPRYQGKPCARGHAGVRFTSNGQCVDCQRHAATAKRASNPMADRQRVATWQANNPGALAARQTRYRQRHASDLADKARAYRQSDPNGTLAAARQARASLAAERELIRQAERQRLAPIRKAAKKAKRKLREGRPLDEFDTAALELLADERGDW